MRLQKSHDNRSNEITMKFKLRINERAGRINDNQLSQMALYPLICLLSSWLIHHFTFIHSLDSLCAFLIYLIEFFSSFYSWCTRADTKLYHNSTALIPWKGLNIFGRDWSKIWLAVVFIQFSSSSQWHDSNEI
jgi:hypothetical protein